MCSQTSLLQGKTIIYMCFKKCWKGALRCRSARKMRLSMEQTYIIILARSQRLLYAEHEMWKDLLQVVWRNYESVHKTPWKAKAALEKCKKRSSWALEHLISGHKWHKRGNNREHYKRDRKIICVVWSQDVRSKKNSNCNYMY